MDKFIMILALAGLLLSCGGSKTNSSNAETNSEKKPVTLPEKLKAHVVWMCDQKPVRNFRNLKSMNECADYIKKHFEAVGLKVSFQEFEVQGNTYKNVVTSVGPKDAPVIVVGAHYDVCSHTPGADDNASAVAGLIELAAMLKKSEEQLKYRVELVAYTLEEPPFFGTKQMGSFIHAESMKKAKVDLRMMFVLEMIGYFTDKEGSQKYPLPAMSKIYPNKGNFIALVSKLGSGEVLKNMKTVFASGSDIPIETLAAPSFVQGVDFSDHRNYWKFGYNAVMITDTAFMHNKNYHQKTDTPDTLDYDKMAEVVKGTYKCIMDFDKLGVK